MSISDRMRNELQGSSLIRKMFETAARLRAERGEDAIVDLSLGNPTAPPPPEFFDQLRKIAASPMPAAHRYNSSNAGLSETRQAIAARLQKEHKLPITANHLVMCSGAGGGLNVTFRALLDPGDEVLVLVPYFSEYPYYLGNYGAVCRLVETDERFQPNIDRIAEACGPKTKGLIINSPNNPTGEVYSQQTINELGELIREKEKQFGHAIYLVSDEPYLRIVYDDTNVASVFAACDNVVIVRSFSKDLSLAGERLGYIAISPRAAAAEDIAAACTLATRVLGFVNAPTIIQRVVAGCLDAQVNVDFYQRNRDLLYDALTSSGYEVRKPLGAFYLFPKCPHDQDDLTFCDKLQQKGLLAVPGRGFGKPGYFRLSYAVEHDTAERAAKILAEPP